MFIFGKCIKEAVVLTFLILRFVFERIFSPEKINFFTLHFLFAEVCLIPSVILHYICRVKGQTLHEFVLYNSVLVLKNVFTIQYSTLSVTGSQYVFLKCDGLIWDLEGKFRQKQIHMFWDFWNLIFNLNWLLLHLI